MSQRQYTGGESSRSAAEDWSSVADPSERRKIQNKLAQRKFRAKAKEQKDDNQRELQNKERAGSAYRTPEPSDLQAGRDLSGLPWGGPSMQYIMQTGKAKAYASQQSSRETSVYAAASRTGGSSRLGLYLTDQFARGYPAWRFFSYHQPGSGSR